MTARHSVNQISKQQVAQLGLGVAGIFFPEVQEASPAIGSGLGLLFLKYGRDDERQADELGFAYSTKSGYAASEFEDVFEALGRMAGKEEGRLPNWLSTHPSSEERVETARTRAAALAPQAAGQRVGEAEFLRQIDGLAYGENPRHGFFRENAFYHPDLRSVFGSWRVADAEPAAGGCCGGAGHVGGHRVDARSWGDGGAGVQRLCAAVGASARSTGTALGERPSRSGRRIRRQDTKWRHPRHCRVRGAGRRVYRIVGYGAATRYADYAPAVNATIQSFQTVSDPDVLGVRGNRIAIVQVPRDLTLAEFAKQFPSTVPVEQLAVINHLTGCVGERSIAGHS